MEMNLIDLYTMYFGLGFCDILKDLFAELLHLTIEAGVLLPPEVQSKCDTFGTLANGACSLSLPRGTNKPCARKTSGAGQPWV